MQLRSLTVLSFVLASTLAASEARAQQWNDGSFSTMEHLCWQGIFDPIPEVLAYTYVGFNGLPTVGQVYTMRIVVAGLGCSGAWVLPEVKLPRATTFAIDAGHPVVCRLGPFGAAQPLTDGSCPQQVSTAGVTHGGFYSFVPTSQPYWPLPPGKELIIEFPVVSSAPLYGLGSSTDFLVGGAIFLDNSPGNPVPSYDVPQAGYTSGIPNGGAYQGVYVQAAVGGGGVSGLPAGSTDSRFAFGDTDISGIVEIDSETVQLDVQARIYNADCFCNGPTGGELSCPYTVDGCCSQDNVHFLQSVAMSFYPKDPLATDTTVYDPYWDTYGCIGQSQSGLNTQYFCKFRFTGVKYGVEYVYQTSPLNGALYHVNPATCAPSGNGPAPSELRTFRLDNPHAPVRYRVISKVEGSGAVVLAPESSCGGPGDCASGVYVPGANVIATATADAGSVFDHWVVDASASTETGPVSFAALDKDHAVTAVFRAETGGDSGPGGSDGGGAGGDGAGAGGDSDGNAQDDPASGDGGGCNAAGSSAGVLMALAAVLGVRRFGRR